MSDREIREDKIRELQNLLGGLEEKFARQKQSSADPELNPADRADYIQMRQRAVKYLATDKGRSAGQVRRVLKADFPEKAEQKPRLIEVVIEQLSRDQYLDEYLCGRRLIKRHQGRKQKAKSYLLYLLKEQGISQTVIDSLAAEIKPDELTAKEYFMNRIDEWDFDNPQKIARHFASRGYASGIFHRIMREYADGKIE